MYSFKNRVFVVWGGNKDLAEKVSKRLMDKVTEATVGGDLTDLDSNYYIGPRIVAQMSEASECIILVKADFDEKIERYRFRENLMFEWGFLLSRLKKGKLFVFLTNCERTALPSDLQGAFTFVVPRDAETLASQASWIVKKYKESKVKENFLAFDLFANWPRWRVFFERQVNGSDAPQPDLFGPALVSAFPPALYAEDLEFYGDLLNKIDRLENGQNQYVTMAISMYEYTKFARSKKDSDFNSGDFTNIKRKFSFISGDNDSFLASVAQQFMGLCLRHEAILANRELDYQNSCRLLDYSMQHFLKANNYFETSNIDERTKFVWLSYISANISNCFELMGQIDQSMIYMEKSLQFRQNVLSNLREEQSPFIYQSILAEYYINCLRYSLISNKKHEEYNDIVSHIKRKEKIPGGYVWTMLLITFQRTEEFFKDNLA
ncbi:putative nucleotide-binding protein with TIR-like domain [Breoghania corrubedonensis]|uniref:Putative nucleotide-binding protein with TIR-like domain n=1 Tax=Breoghania corrubedonensis TaxID=665038 RepID=A0A2T5V4P4_9HYPH|nr:TIR domain-containing protein [Breoghania corrubedonensis]PTW58732.1 putative nucleotide-binding protein with TIR-like domain [Breoghania corrubedonensis]